MEVQKKKRGPLPKLTPMQAKFAEALVFFEGRRYAYEAAVEALGYGQTLSPPTTLSPPSASTRARP